MKKLFVPFVACVLAACSSNEQQATSYDVIPLPQEITISQENPFKLSKNTVIAYPKDNDLLKRKPKPSKTEKSPAKRLFLAWIQASPMLKAIA